MQCVGDADGEAEAEQSLSQAERPEVAIAQEQRARDDAPYQRGCGEHEIGQVRRGEERSGERHSGGFTRDQAQHSVHEIVLQKKLLVDGPEQVAGDVGEIGFVERMQRADFRCDEDAQGSERCCGRQDPQRGNEAAPAQAEVVATLAACEHYRQSE